MHATFIGFPLTKKTHNIESNSSHRSIEETIIIISIDENLKYSTHAICICIYIYKTEKEDQTMMTRIKFS